MFAGHRAKKNAFRIMVVGLVFLFGVAISADTIQSQGTEAATAESGQEEIAGGRRRISSSDQIELYFTSDTQLLEIEDKRSGYIWKSAVDPNLFSDMELSDFWRSNLSALFQFTYYDHSKSDKANTMQSNSLSKGVKLTQSLIDGGIALNFNFSELGIRLTVEVRLDRDAVKFTIPQDSLKETKGYGLVSLTLLPFLGAAAGDDEGYMVYPDGSGALHRFSQSSAAAASALQLDIYGSRSWSGANMNELLLPSVKTAALPIFGVCRGGHTFVGIVEDEAFESTVEVSPNGVSVPMDRIANVFTFRRSYTVIKPDVKGGETAIVKMENDVTPGDRSVLYAFLPQDSGYSGMANRYREYLLETGVLSGPIKENADVPLMLDLFMGISESQVLIDKYITMTDFKAAKSILSDLASSGVSDIRSNLIGWQDGGYGQWPNHFPAEAKLGGNAELKSLNEWAADAGIILTLQENYMLAQSESSGFIQKSNYAYTKGSLLLTNSSEKLFLMSPLKTWSRFESNLITAANLAVNGFCFDGIGQYLYPDYNAKNTVTRAQAQQIWLDMLKKTREETGYVCLTGGNAYLLSQVDFLHNITIHDSGYFLSDESIPLYQMVVHGYIPYTAEEPENLFYDTQKQWLRMLEYGAVPYFQLTENNPGELVNTDYNFLFTSRFAQWKDTLLARVREYNAEYKALYSSAMVEHRRLSEDVVRVTYENGMRLYVNYGENAAQADGFTIDALDALVVPV